MADTKQTPDRPDGEYAVGEVLGHYSGSVQFTAEIDCPAHAPLRVKPGLAGADLTGAQGLDSFISFGPVGEERRIGTAALLGSEVGLMVETPEEQLRQAAHGHGSDSYHAGYGEAHCPFKPGTIFFDDWHDGWNAAKQGE